MTWPPPDNSNEALLDLLLSEVKFPNNPTNQHNNKENTMSTETATRDQIIKALQNVYGADTDEINTFLEELVLEPIPTTVDICATYRVSVTFCDVPLGDRDPADLSSWDLENMLDDEGLYPSFGDADDVELEEAEVV